MTGRGEAQKPAQAQCCPEWEGEADAVSAVRIVGDRVSAAAIAQTLGGKRAGRDSFMCCCPAHDDKNPSLSVSDRDGKVLVKCFAGCEQSMVIDALKGLDLWERSIDRSVFREKQTKPLGPVVAEYIYTDEQYRPLIRVTRHFPPKDFRQWRPNAAGGWTAGTGNARRPLYRLPEVIESSIIFIVEGEKDVESLRSMGFVATCNPMGAGKWRDEYNPLFSGKSVILIPDRDDAGRDHAMTVLAGVSPFASDTCCIDLESAKDVSEWFEQGHSEVELMSLLEAHWAKSGSLEGVKHG